jgi:ribosomal protein S27AE
MLIIHGFYRWGRRLLAFRNDYCLSCGMPRMAFQHRTFDVLHIFWVPVLPLGFWKRWHCGTCGKNPHSRVGTARTLKWIGVAALAVFAAAAWSPAADRDLADPVLRWSVRLGAVALTIAAAIASARSRPPEKLAEKLRAIQPNRDSTCPVCATTLTVASPWYRCGKCGLERQALPVR